MIRFKFITSVSFDVSDADVIIHTYLFTYFSKNQGGPLDSHPGFRINLLQCALAVSYNSRQRVLWQGERPLFIRIRV